MWETDSQIPTEKRYQTIMFWYASGPWADSIQHFFGKTIDSWPWIDSISHWGINSSKKIHDDSRFIISGNRPMQHCSECENCNSRCSSASPMHLSLLASCCAFFLRRHARDASLFFSLRLLHRELNGISLTCKCRKRENITFIFFPNVSQIQIQSISFTMTPSGIWKSVTVSKRRLTLPLYPIIFTKRSIGTQIRKESL